MSAEMRLALNTKEIQCELNASMLRSRYVELAFCRIMQGRALSLSDKTRVEFYKEGSERARRCVEGLLKPRQAGRVVFPEIRAEVRRWVAVAERAPLN